MSLFNGESMSPADIAAVTGNNNFGFGGDGAWWLLILFLFAFNGGGWGNNAGTTYNVDSSVQRGFDQSAIMSSLNGITSSICNGFSNAEISANARQIADMQQAFDTWSSQGLGVLIGEWGITDHWLTNDTKTRIHENMSYYCKTFISECLKRGFSTFVWDNNSFASFNNYSEKFGIFDRWNNMTLKADWMVNGIKAGIATGIEEVMPNDTREPVKVRKILHKGKLLIQKGNKSYTLEGCEF